MMLVISLSGLAAHLRPSAHTVARLIDRIGRALARPRQKSLPIFGFSDRIRRDIGFDP